MGQILVGGASAEFSALHHAFFVGDILIKRDCKMLQSLAPNVNIVNMYGRTETQRAVSFFEIPSRKQDPRFLDGMKDVIPAGRGMYDVQLLVVNTTDQTKMCGFGEIGEIYVRAGGLAEGYLGDPTLSERKFVQNWFVDPQKWIELDRKKEDKRGTEEPWRSFYLGPRDRLYRSGDLGRYLPSGDVECTGRADDQVKIRGFKIELGEINKHLSDHPLIRERITLVRRDKDEEPTLVSYIVPEFSQWPHWLKEKGLEDRPEEEGMVGMLRRFHPLREDVRVVLKSKLPSYAVPSVIIPLTRMPLNPNGKIDKPALPFPDVAELAAAAPRKLSATVSALSPTERTIANIWADLITHVNPETVSPEDSFFDLGGHSILAQKMLLSVKREWRDAKVSMTSVFRSPTLRGFAHEIEGARSSNNFLNGTNGTVPNANGEINGSFRSVDEEYARDAQTLAEYLPKRFLSRQSQPLMDSSTNLTVFLTGATGFLGAFILKDLLSRKSASLKVIAHVRSKKSKTPFERIRNTCQAYGIWSDSWSSKIECVTGNLGDRRLGPLGFAILESQGSNVQATMEALALCAEGKPKQFGYVSSTSVLDTDHYVQLSQQSIQSGGMGVSESDNLQGSSESLGTGYGRSKWISEYLVREAGRRGLSGSIVRPGYVTGDSKTGVTNTDDFLIRMIKGCMQLSSRPDITNTINMVPVDHVARVVVAATFFPPTSPLGVAQVTSHPRLTFNEFLATLQLYGYDVPKVNYDTWRAILDEFVEDSSEDKEEAHALMPLYHFVTGDLPQNTRAPELDDTNAAAALQADGKWTGEDVSEGTGVTEDLLGIYLSYLVAIGFVPPPHPAGKVKPLPQIALTKKQQEALNKLGGRGGTNALLT